MSKKIDRTQHPRQEKLETTSKPKQTCELHPSESLRPGRLCPRCGEGRIDYNGMLDLVCPVCGLTEAGACT